MTDRAGQLGGPRAAWQYRILVVECAVGQGGRSARGSASIASPGPHFQRPLLWLRDFVLQQCLSSKVKR